MFRFRAVAFRGIGTCPPTHHRWLPGTRRGRSLIIRDAALPRPWKPGNSRCPRHVPVPPSAVAALAPLSVPRYPPYAMSEHAPDDDMPPPRLPWHHRAPVLTMALNLALILTIFLTRERWAAWQAHSHYRAPWERSPAVNADTRRAIFFGDRLELRDMDSGDLVASYAGEWDHSRVGFSPDGSRVWMRRVVSGDVSWWSYCPPMVVDAISGEVLFSAKVDKKTESVVFSPGGAFVFIASSDGETAIHDTASGKVLFSAEAGREVKSISFSPGGEFVFIASADDDAAIYTTASGKSVASFPRSRPRVTFSQSGQYALVEGPGDGKAELWDSIAGERLMAFRDSETYQAGFLPGEEYLAATFWDEGTMFFELVNLKTRETRVSSFYYGSMQALVYLSRCSTKMFHGKWSGKACLVRILDVLTGKEISRFSVPTVAAMPSFTASERFVCTPTNRGTSLHDTKTGRLINKRGSVGYTSATVRHHSGSRRLFMSNPKSSGITILDVESGAVTSVVRDVSGFHVISDDAIIAYFPSSDSVGVLRCIRPEQWWGVFWLPHLYLIIALALAVAWSGWRDVKRLRQMQ